MRDEFDWNDEGKVSDGDTVSEYDMVADTYKDDYVAPGPPKMVDAEEEILQQIEDEAAFELDSEESNIIYNARLRLEQARLYEMLINHDMFEGVDASPEAIENVRNELKEYIVERLEVLLGLKTPKPKQQESIEIELPFNEIEIEFLKQLSYKGTKGASAGAAAYTAATSELKPMASIRAKTGLKKISRKKVPKKAIPKQKAMTDKKVEVVEKPLRANPKRKPRRKPREEGSIDNKVKKRSFGVQQLTQDQADNIARQDMIAMEKRGKWSKKTSKQKAKEIARVNEQHARHNKTESKTPIPDESALMTHYMTQQARHSQSNDMGKVNDLITNLVINKKIRQS